MPYRFFVVRLDDRGEAQEELNRFVRGHRVLAVDKRWVEQGPESFWAFCVDFLDGDAGRSPGGQRGGQRNRVDYREVLTPEQFTLFSKLRDLRKVIAQEEAVPVYAVFTNEQLAQMVQARITSKGGLETIVGVGDARVGRYGERVIALMVAANGDAADAPGEGSV